MKNILLRGPFLTSSGYGVHSRQIARHFLENYKDCNIKIEPLNWGLTSWKINPEDEDGLIGKIMSRTGDKFSGKPDLSVQIQLPNEWDSNLAKVNVGVTAGIETDKCNPSWIECINKMNAVIVPSKHVKDTFENTSKNITTPIEIIPESFHDSFLGEPKDLNLDLNTNFNFLLVGQLTAQTPEEDRKNTFYAIKWFCEQFKERKDVGLIVKTNRGRNTTLDYKVVLNMFTKLIREVRVGDYPKIHFLHGNLSTPQMNSLYRDQSIKALLAPTKGEGYGLPILESAVCGLPVIATNWSGHLDFMKLGKFISLDYSLIPISQQRTDNNIFIEGSKWAMPYEEDFKRKIEKFVKKGDSIPKKWALDLAEKLKENYSHQKISKIYLEFFKEYL